MGALNGCFGWVFWMGVVDGGFFFSFDQNTIRLAQLCVKYELFVKLAQVSEIARLKPN